MRGRGGTVEIPVHTVDGLLVARRIGLPVRMVSREAEQPGGGMPTVETRASERPVEASQRVAEPLAPFRAVVVTLAWPEIE